jgi:chromosome partitioning protein
MKANFTAGRLKEITGASPNQIEAWEREGVLSPERNNRNHRIFTRDDVRRALELTGHDVRKRIAVLNQKGGVGKTTTVFNLSAALALDGRRVLAVDLDAQASLTHSFGLDPSAFERTSHDLLVDDDVDAESVVTPTKVEGLALIPADIRLASADVLLREMIMRERILMTKLAVIEQRFDIILFDCPPNLSTITINALVASSEAIVPMETQYYSVKAVEDLTRTFHLLSSRMNHTLSVWMLPTKIDRRMKVSREILSKMEESFAGRMLTPIRTDANVMKAPMAHEPAVTAFPTSRGSRDYRRVACEVVAATRSAAHRPA